MNIGSDTLLQLCPLWPGKLALGSRLSTYEIPDREGDLQRLRHHYSRWGCQTEGDAYLVVCGRGLRNYIFGFLVFSTYVLPPSVIIGG